MHIMRDMANVQMKVAERGMNNSDEEF